MSPSPRPAPAARRHWRRRTTIVIASAAIGSLVLAPEVLPAFADSSPHAARAGALTALQPAAGSSWIQGVLTDQAGNPLNNVNVEVWPNDPNAATPVASNLSYAGTPADVAHQSGVFRVEVPSGRAYRITISTVGGREDGDQFRMSSIGGGAPIMARTGSRQALLAVPGRTLELGTVQLARQGRVASTITAKAAKRRVAAGKRGTLRVRVTSPFVTNVTGKVQVRVGGKTVTRHIGAFEHGRISIKLPKLKAGKHSVHVAFLGSSTVSRDKAKAVRFVVK
ncbi:Ig-like domain-containing protein [Nocardioides conyzicola]|uniref:Ig-like domain repeat protein n=1 Tax=Nocardioides conyzicola TaxID=1651781 RepID=A0ABP8WX58_9ACTN